MSDLNPYRAPATSPADASDLDLASEEARRLRRLGLPRETTLRAIGFANALSFFMIVFIVSLAPFPGAWTLWGSGHPGPFPAWDHSSYIWYALGLSELPVAYGLERLRRWGAVCQTMMSTAFMCLGVIVLTVALVEQRPEALAGTSLVVMQIGWLYLVLSEPSRFLYRRAYHDAMAATPNMSASTVVALKTIFAFAASSVQLTALWLALGVLLA